jgi:acetyl-CoA acyltransferase
MHTPGERVAVIAGLRTPFARQFTLYKEMNAIDLGILVTSELLARLDLDHALIERLVYGQVWALPEAPNIAREVVLGAGMNARTDAYSVSRACATSLQAIVDIAQAIMLGEIEIGLAGGADSTSAAPTQLSRKLSQALMQARKAKTLTSKLKFFKDIRLRDLLPVALAVKDYTTEMSMGDSAEQMAKNHGIDREEQDKFVLRSHQLAQQAWDEGKLDSEVMRVFLPSYQESRQRDNTIRAGLTLEQLAALRPVFDRRHGTVTAGNSTPLTDGAVSLLLMKEKRARKLGYDPLGYLRSYAFVAIDPFNDALMGPSYATPIALTRAGLRLNELNLITIHEAFAAQTLANLKNWPSQQFARNVLGQDDAIGEIDWDKLNPLGGSLAYGHPFAATGGRMIIQTLHGLHRRGGGPALVTACAAGGIGAALVLEVA